MSVTSKRMRVAIYARVSTKDKGQDTENQLIDLREFAERSGWEITREYIDHESAKTGDREEFKALMRDAGRRKFGIALVWALDRFTREGIEATFAYLRRLKEAGVDFVSYTESHFRTTGPAGELILAIAAWIAEQERKRISERVRAGIRRVQLTGVTRSGKPIGRARVIVDRQKVRERHAEGASFRILQNEFGLSRGTVQRIVKDQQTNPQAA